jgi:uncharacterized protein (TIRG00374 family)
VAGVLAASALLGALGLGADWRQIREAVAHADWALVPMAMLFTAVSYGCLGYGFAAVSRIFGIRIARRPLVAIGLVSVALNHFLAAGGLGAHALRLVLLGRRGLTPGEILAASLFCSVLNDLALLAILPTGLACLLMGHPLSPRAVLAVGAATGLIGLVFGVAIAIVCSGVIRRGVLGLIRGVWRRVARRDAPRPPLRDLDAAIARGVGVIRNRPVVLALPLALTLSDWVSGAAALAVCFDALGRPVRPDVLVTGFAIGIAAGLFSMVPGGLGVQEGSMAGVYVLLGVSLEQALLASVLFRIVYYVIPFAASLVVYRRLAEPVRPATSR